MQAFVTGGAGFIGSHMVDALLEAGWSVRAYDNLSTGRLPFLAGASNGARFELVVGDLLEADPLAGAMEGTDVVFHLAANADVRYGLDEPRRDLRQNTLATFNVLEAMRRVGTSAIVFTSTGSVYGETAVVPTPEDCPFPVQTSLYGASKLACEALLQAYSEGYGFSSWIFRLVSALGERYTHGHVVDFVRHVAEDPSRLPILGDGTQRKSYLYVKDCVAGMLLALERAADKVNILNIGTDEYSSVADSIAWISDELGVRPRLEFSGGRQGWVGDNPFIFLDCARLRSLGWAPTLTIREAVVRTVRYLRANPDVLWGEEAPTRAESGSGA